jgi:DNA-binding response OmpR family regulator
MRVLVAEDDPRLAEVLKTSLDAAGFTAEIEQDGEAVWFKGDTEDFAAAILDLGLPKLDGLTVLKRWRGSGAMFPVLIVTARDEWEERVEAIEAGADDYVVKPFRVQEVLARLRAIIRRAGGAATNKIEFGDFVLDRRLMQVTQGGMPISLTPHEYKVVAYLLHRRGEVVSQLQLTEHLYGQDFDRDSNSIEVLVARVRKRLGVDMIKTRRGFGYFIDGPAS